MVLAMIKIKKGNEVRLKTGGPRMTVEEVLSNGKALCSYIFDFREFRRDVFPVEKLELAGKFKFYPEELLD